MVNTLGHGRELIVGKVLKFTFNKPGILDKYFEVQLTDQSTCFCKGKVTPGKDIAIGKTLSLTGEWKVNENPKYRSLGKQFYFKAYDILPMTELSSQTIPTTEFVNSKPTKVIRRPTTNSPTTLTPIDLPIATKVASHLKEIGALKMTYEPNKPKQNTIAQHVWFQLNERVISSTPNDKDFYFLTAILDRYVSDKKVQSFRRSNRDFKGKLLNCWIDAPMELDAMICDIDRRVSKGQYLDIVSKKSNSFKVLKDTVPGGKGLEQLLACLKIIKEKYHLRYTYNINKLVQSLEEEFQLRQYLIGLHGVEFKIANWALTNITGHWFVIDEPNIKPMIKKDLADTIPLCMEVSAKNADAIFRHWFGGFDETNKEYENFSRKQFIETFPDFPFWTCEYLPFIVTQYLWFYGKKISLWRSKPRILTASSYETKILNQTFTTPVETEAVPADILCRTDWQEAKSMLDLFKCLPSNIKPKKIWPNIPEQLKGEIIKRAQGLSTSRNFAAPAEWDGSLKEALLLMDKGRLPNGFKNFLGFL